MNSEKIRGLGSRPKYSRPKVDRLKAEGGKKNGSGFTVHG